MAATRDKIPFECFDYHKHEILPNKQRSANLPLLQDHSFRSQSLRI